MSEETIEIPGCGRVPIEKALQFMTPQWIAERRYSVSTIQDMRNALTAANAANAELREELQQAHNLNNLTTENCDNAVIARDRLTAELATVKRERDETKAQCSVYLQGWDQLANERDKALSDLATARQALDEAKSEAARHEHNWQVAEAELKEVTVGYQQQLASLRGELAEAKGCLARAQEAVERCDYAGAAGILFPFKSDMGVNCPACGVRITIQNAGGYRTYCQQCAEQAAKMDEALSEHDFPPPQTDSYGNPVAGG